MTTLINLRNLTARWLALDFASRPTTALQLGIDSFAGILPDHSPDTHRRHKQDREELLDQISAIDTRTLDLPGRHELSLLKADIVRVKLLSDLEPWHRAPYIYPEEIGNHIHYLISDRSLPPDRCRQALLLLLQQIPEFFHQATANLIPEDIPRPWMTMAQSAAHGVSTMLTEVVPHYLSTSPADAPRSDIEAAQQALQQFTTFLLAVADKASGSFAAGTTHIDDLLTSFHLLPIDSSSLLTFGHDMVEHHRALMIDRAHAISPDSDWQSALTVLQDDHPDPQSLLTAYHQAVTDALQHIIDHNLITIPPDQDCTVEETPAFMRSSIPLGVMNTSPPFAHSNFSRLLITPVDPSAPPEQQLEYLREQNYGFIRSIAFHEVYPGHHLQSVLHKQGKTPIHKKVRSPLLVEGWGLYTEDLMEETGFLHTPALKFFKARNALWRAVRIVIDIGLHTGDLTPDQAIKLLATETGQSNHMAKGEVMRYTRHDNPTYQSCYMYGQTMIKKLRKDYRSRTGNQFTLRRFHDQLLAHGSPPVSLISELLLADDRPSTQNK